MYVKLLLGDLNRGPSSPHPTSTYTCGVTIVARVCDKSTTSLLPKTYKLMWQ